MYKKSSISNDYKKRLKEPRHFPQVMLGPRQVGKTTVIKQVVNDLNLPYQIYFRQIVFLLHKTSWFQTVGIRQEYRCE